MAKNNNWNVVLECADEEGDLSTWAKEINHPVYGRYVWVSSICEDVVVVEVQAPETHEIIELKSCKTVQAAKRWATMNLDVEVDSSESIAYDNEPCEYEVNFVDYGLLDSIAKSISDCDVDLDIVNLINTAYIENEEFNEAMSDYPNDLLEKSYNHIMDVIIYDNLTDCKKFFNSLKPSTTSITHKFFIKMSYLLSIALNFKRLTHNCISKYVSDFILIKENKIPKKKLMLNTNGIYFDLDVVNGTLIKHRDMFSEYQVFYNRLVDMFSNNGEYGLINLLSRISETTNRPYKFFTPVEVLMHDDCTKSEAIKHLDRGTVVFELSDFYNFLEDTNTEYDDIKDDCKFLIIEGQEYVIMYVL